MNKNVLLEHLNAVRDAENAAQACRQGIEALQTQMNNRAFYVQAGVKYDYPLSEPQRPQMITEKNENENENSGCIPIAIGGLLGFSTIFSPDINILITLFVTTPIGMFAGGLLSEYIIKTEKENEHQKVMETNESNMRRYEKTKKEYDEAKEKWMKDQKKIELQIRSGLQDIIDENKKTLSKIQLRLRQLYGMGIIYVRFQNMVAVNTLQEYVEMGLCDKLEGSDGAYSVYLQDLRTEKICGSIEDLKHAMVVSIAQIANNQGRLIHEVQAIDNDVRMLEQAVNQSLAGLNQGMQKIQSDVSANQSMQAQRTQMIAEQMQSMNRTIKNTAYNDYIQKRIETTDRYLRTHYRNPSE